MPVNLGLGFGHSSAAVATGQTLGELKAICQYHGWEDNTSDGDAALGRFINRTLQLLATLAPWPEYHKRAGSVSISSGTANYTLIQSNIAQRGRVVITDKMTPLKEIDGGMDEWMLKNKTQSWAGEPTSYATRKFVEDGDVKTELLLYPEPNSSDTLYYTYRLMPVELVEDSDHCDWPDS